MATATPLPMIGSSLAGAAPGDAQPTLDNKSVNVTQAEGGDLITYTVNFSCSNVGDDDCSGAVFTDPLPTFTDVYGDQIPVEFVSATGPAGIWGDPQFTLDTSDPDQPVVSGTAENWPAGTSGVIAITLRVPPGSVPEGTQTLDNTATVADPVDAPDYTDDSTTATTDITGQAPDWEISKLGPTEEFRPDRPYTWTISVCTDDPASAAWPVFDVTDTLPPGFEYISSDPAGIYTDDGTPPDTTSDGAATVTWQFDAENPPPLGDDGCFRVHVTGQFPSDLPVNAAGEVKTNTASGSGSTDPEDPGTDLGEDTATGEMVGPQFGGASMSKSFSDTDGAADFFVADGDTGRFNLGVAVDSDFRLDRVVVDDGTWEFTDGGPVASGGGMPESFTATQIDPGEWNDPATATIEGSDDGVTWTEIASGVSSGAPVIDLAPTYRSVRWVWDRPILGIRGDFTATGLQVIGTIGAPVDDFGRYTNIATATVERDGAPPFTTTGEDDYQLETPQPHPGITKDTSATSRQPGQPVTFTIRVDNDPDATGDLTNPVVSDCVPQYLDLDGTPDAPAPWTAGPPLTCGAGETPVSYQYLGTLEPGDATPPITITAIVADADPGPVAPYGDYVNTAYVGPDGGGPFGHCQNTDPSCGDEASVSVLPTVQLDSGKCVSGELDAGVYRPTPRCTDGEPAVVPAQTLPGATIDYRLDLSNVGNTDAEEVVFIDILPHEGDTAVITRSGGNLVARNSEFTPLLISPITAPTPWQVEYSTSTNPCRPEVGGPTTGCEAPNWTATPNLLQLGTYRSIRFTLTSVLARGENATFTWRMRAPAADDTFDQGGTDPDDPFEFLDGCSRFAPESDPTHCPRAVNSFAWGAESTNLPPGAPQIGRLYAEPPQVEVRVVAPPYPNAVGDRVWYDEDFDGIQDDGEAGAPGMAIGLFTPDGTPLATTSTDADGFFVFSTVAGLPLPNGDYVLRLYPPDGWSPSPQDQTGSSTDQGAPLGTNPGTNTNDDSDGPRTPTGTDVVGDYYETVVFELGDNPNNPLVAPIGEADPTWDFGIWRAEPDVAIDKVTKDSAWPDDQYGDGVVIVHDRPVTWRYTVTNTGNSRLANVTVTDDGGPDPAFAVTDCTITDDGQNADGLLSSATAPIALNRGASMVCTATGTAGSVDYANDATVVGTPVTDDGAPVPVAPPGFPAVPATVTDADPSSYVAGIYDLALAKTVGTPDLATGEVTFTITVRNQGSLPSGDHTVMDSLTPGLSVTSTAPEAATTTGDASSGIDLTWDLDDLAPGGERTITIQAHIDDYLERPYRNLAEISSDSAAEVVTGTVPTPTADIDSTPDDDPADDGDYGPIGTPSAIDNTDIAQAGTGPDAPPTGEDDADVADMVPDIRYDLALAKVADATPVPFGVDPVFSVRVYNQGNVPSGDYAVLDQLPTGLSFDEDASSADCTAEGAGQVRCAGTNIQPGASATFTVATTIDGTPDDYSTAPWRNWAEIDADSAQDLYAVDDVDSVPESEQSNGVGADDTPPGDVFVDVATAGDAYAEPGGGDEDDNDAAVVATSVEYDLALAKTVAATPVTATDDATVTYTVTVQNQGTVDSGPYAVTDVVPAGITVDDADGASATLNGDGTTTLTWSADDLAPDATATFTVEATVTDLLQRPFRNVAEISADSSTALYGITDTDSTPDADPANDGNYGTIGASDIDNLDIDDAGVGPDAPPTGEDDADIADVTFPLSYDLALTKVASADTITFDQTITYTVTVQNQGVLDSGAYTVTDEVPAGLAVVPGSISDGGTSSGSTITWSLDGLDASASRDLTFQATVDDVSLRPFRNVAEISADSADSYSVPSDTIADADSTPDADPTNDGDYGTIGASTIDNLDIDDAGVGPDAPPSGEDDADIADVDVDVRYDLALIKVGPAQIDPLGAATFTITVQNQGNVPSGPYTVTDTLPAGMVASAASDAGVIGGGGTSVSWTDLPSLDPEATAELTVTASVPTIPDGLNQRPFVNFAEITADSSGEYTSAGQVVTDVDSIPGDAETSDADSTALGQAGVGDDEGFDDEDIAVVTTEIVYDLALVKTVDRVIVPIDGTSTFTVAVRNQGNVPSGIVEVTDDLPPGLGVVSVNDGGVLTGSRIVWTIDDLAPGQTVELTFEVEITDIELRPYINRAEITADSANDYSTVDDPVRDADSTPGDVETSLTDNLIFAQAGFGADAGFDDEDVAIILSPVSYDLALAKTVDSPTIAFDGTATFSITVANQGNVPSGEYVVTDTLPPGLTATDISDGGVLSSDGTSIVWTLPSLDADSSTTLTFDTTIDDIATRPWTNVAEITSDGAAGYSSSFTDVTDRDSTPGDDATSAVDNLDISEAGAGDDGGFDDEDIAVLDAPVVYDLAIDKTLLPGQTYVKGDTVSYEVTVTNEGNVPSGTYSFTDTIPPGMSFASASDGGTADGQVVTWTDRPSLGPGESSTVTVGATLDDVSLGSYRNWVQITTDSSDEYSTDTEQVRDADSTPDNGEAGEDDDDAAELPVDEVRDANADRGGGAAPSRPGAAADLAITGGDSTGPIRFATALLIAGAALVLGVRRRRALLSRSARG